MQISFYLWVVRFSQNSRACANEFDNKALVVAQKTHYLRTLMPVIYLNMVFCAVSSIPCHMKNDENCIKVLIEGLYRAKLVDIQDTDEEEAVLRRF